MSLEIEKIIEHYERRSAFTCEHCGNFGKLRKHLGYNITICNRCYEEKYSE